ncbi:MAG TPA: hypothetical protein VJS67_14055 [Pseudonocardiaceae bacterium]|nr:hypothetical protein [Pseudonocardiaceae bacterium]
MFEFKHGFGVDDVLDGLGDLGLVVGVDVLVQPVRARALRVGDEPAGARARTRSCHQL